MNRLRRRRRRPAVLPRALLPAVAAGLFALTGLLQPAGGSEAVRLVYAPRQGLEVFWTGGCREGASLLVEAPAILFSAPAFEISVREAGRMVEARCPDLQSLIVAGFDRLSGERVVGGFAERAQMWSFIDRPEFAAGLTRPGRDISGLLFGRETARAGAGADTPSLNAAHAQILASVMAMAAIPLGADTDRRVYVLASPDDPGSRALFHLVASADHGLAWRWILAPAALDHADWSDLLLKTMARGRPGLLRALYGEGAGRDETPLSPKERLIGRRLLEYHFHTLASLQPQLDRLAERRWGFPTLLFVGETGLKAVAGVPYDLDSLAAAVQSAPPARRPPAAREIFAADYREEPLSEGKMAFAVRLVSLRAMPSLEGRVLMRLKKGEGYPAALSVTAGGRRWVALAVFGPGGGYAYAPAEYMMITKP